NALHADGREGGRRAWQETVASEGELALEYRLQSPDGKTTWVLATAAGLRDAAGKIVRFLGNLIDITERKNRDQAIQELQQHFHSAFEDAPIAMALIAPDGSCRQVNRALCAIVGYSREALLAMNFQQITHPDDLEGALAFVRKMLAGKIRIYQIEKRCLHKKGHYVWVSFNVTLLRDPSGEPLHFVAQIQDITER